MQIAIHRKTLSGINSFNIFRNGVFIIKCFILYKKIYFLHELSENNIGDSQLTCLNVKFP